MSAQQKNAAAYKYKVTRSAEDGEYVSTCDKYPSLSYLAKSPEEAMRGIIKLAADVVVAASSAGDADCAWAFTEDIKRVCSSPSPEEDLHDRALSNIHIPQTNNKWPGTYLRRRASIRQSPSRTRRRY